MSLAQNIPSVERADGPRMEARHSDSLKGKLTPYLLILPSMLVFLLFFLLPLVFMGILSFSKWNLISPEIPWVGFDNYKAIIQDPYFHDTLKNTFIYTAIYVVAIVGISVPLGVWLNKNTFIHRAAQAAVFSPHIISLVSVAMIWMFMMDPMNGVLNYLLNLFGADGIGWLTDPKIALYALILVTVWKGVGYYTVIVVAALASIPKDLYEAAALDNASPWRTFTKITIPAIAPTIYFIVIINIINAIQTFETINIMTQGGPVNATTTIVYYIYEEGFKNFDIGSASAAGMILLVILMVVTYFYFRLLGRKVQYQ
jgi:sn-glycerol 3-phosphate transport system permease protein